MYHASMSKGWREGQDAAVPAGTVSDTPFADALTDLFGEVKAYFEQAFGELGVPPPCAKALRCIEGPTSMKDLASRLRVDGSFVTAIADALEQRDLARRETDPKDRRVKNLVLTPAGDQLRDKVQQLFEDFPGVARLDPHERAALVILLRKMATGG
jgi:DNA-binding MarR family transcriptional regulator